MDPTITEALQHWEGAKEREYNGSNQNALLECLLPWLDSLVFNI